MFTKRTLILNSLNEDLHKAVVSFEKSADRLKGNLRLYNFKEEPKGVLTLGLLLAGEVYKAGLTKIAGNIYECSCEIKKEISDFTCALVNSYNGEIKPLLIGSSNGASSKSAETRLASCLGVLQKKDMQEVKRILDKENIDLEENIDEIVEQNMGSACEENCILCPYKKAFFEEDNESREEKEITKEESCEEIICENLSKNQEKSQKIIKNSHIFDEKETNNIFYEEISEQLNSLFEKYQAEKTLENIISNSKWVRIDYEDSGMYYVVGLIYENEKVKYICYGVPGIWAENCPEELNGLAEWLPLDENDPHGKGYWISYQDATSGENIKIEVV